MREFLAFLLYFVSLVAGQQKSPICDNANITGTCSHYEVYSLYRAARCCDYEPTVCCYFLPDSLLVTLIIGSGLALLFLTGWIMSCCFWCCCSGKSE